MRTLAASARGLAAVAAAAIAFPIAGAAQSQEAAGAATLTLPAGWIRMQPPGTEVAAFRPYPGAAAVLFAPPGQPVAGSFAAWFDDQWREVERRYAGVAASPPSETRGRDGLTRRIVGGSMEDGTGGYLYVVFCAVRDATWIQPLLYVARDHATYSATGGALESILNSVRLLPPDRRPAPRPVALSAALRDAAALAAEPAPAPIAGGPPPPRPAEEPRAAGVLDGLFVGLSLGSLREISHLRPSPGEEFVAFFADGTFIWWLPQEGFDGLDRRRFAREHPSASGSYRVRGREVLLRFDSGEEVAGERDEQGSLTVPDRAKLVPVAKLDGHLLQGTYRTAWSGTVSFGRDGSFRDDGALGEIGLAAPDGSPRAVATGSGTYRLVNNTLVLRYVGGGELRVAAYILPSAWAGSEPAVLYLNRARLERVGAVPSRPDPVAPLSGLFAGLRRSGGFTPRVTTDYLVFFPDGSVLGRLPDQGLLDLDLTTERRDFAEFWGRYTLDGARLRIAWVGGRESGGRREADGALVVDGTTYRPLAASDGLRLDGIYRAGTLEPDAPYSITFRPDGRFEDRDIRVVVGLTDPATGRLRVEGGGPGRYRIAGNALVLEYADGRREQLSFYVPDGSGPGADVIVVHTYPLVRVSR